MSLKLKVYYRLTLVIYLQLASILAVPLQPVFIAKPQIMMHTLQQPVPIETFQSLKTQPLQRNPVQNAGTSITPTYQIPQEKLPSILTNFNVGPYPVNLGHLESMQVQGQEQIPLVSMLYQKMLNKEQQVALQQNMPLKGQDQIPSVPFLYQQMLNEEQQMALQQQMLALQQFHDMQQLNSMQSAIPWGAPQPQSQPVLILIPDEMTEIADHNELFKNTVKHDGEENELKHEEGYVNEDLESVIVDESDHTEKVKTRKAILLIPNARFSIGGLISTIPWLPIEVNVPDTIAWAWNGISSIISIIGSRLPFRPRPQVQVPQTTVEDSTVKMLLKQLHTTNYETLSPVVPVYVLPMGRVIPIEI